MESNNEITVMNATAMFDAIGIKLDSTKEQTARAGLKSEGAQSNNLSTATASAAYQVMLALRKSDNAIMNACKIMGVLRLNETWKHERDDSGNLFKSENAFLRGILPGYAMSTLSVYADVGATIYVPALMGEYPDMPYLKDMKPGNAKFLLSALKDAAKRALLPAALDEQAKATNGKLTQRGIQAAVKSINNKLSNAKPDEHAGNAGNVADDLSGGAISTTVKSLIGFTYNGDGKKDGDLTALVMEGKVKDFLSLLLKATNDKDTASAVCAELYAIAKAAK